MGSMNPKEKKRRIAGKGSSLAEEFPEVARLFEVSGSDLSRIVYLSVQLMIRSIGHAPDSIGVRKSFVEFLEFWNKFQVIPPLLAQQYLYFTANAGPRPEPGMVAAATGQKPDSGTTHTNGSAKSDFPKMKNPEMEPDFIE